jgi:acetamidase/formamidase
VPRAENREYVMTIGMGGSLERALQNATTAMASALEVQYKLAPAESALVLGFAIRYEIAGLASQQMAVVAKLPKTTIAQLRQR